MSSGAKAVCLERGKASDVSKEVLDALARTQLAVRAAVQRVLDGLDMPAFVENSRLEIIAANQLGRALYAVPGSDLALPFNVAKFLFLDNRRASSTATGTAWPATRSRSCAPRPAVTPALLASWTAQPQAATASALTPTSELAAAASDA
jgi:hypothetical protein